MCVRRNDNKAGSENLRTMSGVSGAPEDGYNKEREWVVDFEKWNFKTEDEKLQKGLEKSNFKLSSLCTPKWVWNKC